MLPSDTARARLEQFRVSRTGQDDPRWKRVQRLPAHLQTHAAELLRLQPTDEPVRDQQELQAACYEAARRLSGLADADRRAVLTAAIPGLADVLDSVWTRWDQYPYQDQYDRRAFRAPGCTAELDSCRHEWLLNLLNLLDDYDPDPEFLATWGAYLADWQGCLGRVLAAAIDRGGPEGERVLSILTETTRGEHPIGGVGRHVVVGLLGAANPSGWEAVVSLLMAAGRQDGTRQVILEAVDEAHPGAFRRVLDVILEQDLLRFSSAIRALDVWCGFSLEAGSASEARRVVEQLRRYLDSATERRIAREGGDPASVYLALWAEAHRDALQAIELARPLFEDPDPDRRLAAIHLISLLRLAPARAALVPVLRDPDPCIAFTAFQAIREGVTPVRLACWYSMKEVREGPEPSLAGRGLFEELEALVARVPARAQKSPPRIWPWLTLHLERTAVADLLPGALEERSPERLLPHLAVMSPTGRAQVVALLSRALAELPVARQGLLRLCGDAAEWVRREALAAVQKVALRPEEAVGLEALLSRKATDLRRGVLALLRSQGDGAALASADRLLAGKQEPQRLAGLELLVELAEAGRAGEAVRERAAAYRARGGEPGPAESVLLARLENQDRAPATLEDVLGLISPDDLTPAVPPVAGLATETVAARAVLGSLCEQIHTHRQDLIQVKRWDDRLEEHLVGNAGWAFAPGSGPATEQGVPYPLADLWVRWEAERGSELRDEDGMELVRAQVLAEQEFEWSSTGPEGYYHHAQGILEWLVLQQPPTGLRDFLLDAASAEALASPEGPAPPAGLGYRVPRSDSAWFNRVRHHRQRCPAEWSPEADIRLWHLARHVAHSGKNEYPIQVQVEEVLYAILAACRRKGGGARIAAGGQYNPPGNAPRPGCPAGQPPRPPAPRRPPPPGQTSCPPPAPPSGRQAAAACPCRTRSRRKL